MLLYGQWLKLPLDVRIKIANEFGIIKRGSTHVVDNHIQSDGFNVHEVEEALSVERIKEFVSTEETDHEKLWAMMLEKITPTVVEKPALNTAIAPLSKEEVKQFKKEYKERQKNAKTKN